MAPLLSTWLTLCALFWLVCASRRYGLDGDCSLSPGAKRIVASILLALAPLPWILRDGIALGIVPWLFCSIPIAGVGVTMVVAFRPVVGRYLSGVALLGLVRKRDAG